MLSDSVPFFGFSTMRSHLVLINLSDLIVRIYITLIFLFILLAIAFIFGSQNSQMLTLNYLVARVELSVAQAVSLFTLVGFILGLLVAFLWKLLTVIKPKKIKHDIKVTS